MHPKSGPSHSLGKFLPKLSQQPGDENNNPLPASPLANLNVPALDSSVEDFKHVLIDTNAWKSTLLKRERDSQIRSVKGIAHASLLTPSDTASDQQLKCDLSVLAPLISRALPEVVEELTQLTAKGSLMNFATSAPSLIMLALDSRVPRENRIQAEIIARVMAPKLADIFFKPENPLKIDRLEIAETQGLLQLNQTLTSSEAQLLGRQTVKLLAPRSDKRATLKELERLADLAFEKTSPIFHAIFLSCTATAYLVELDQPKFYRLQDLSTLLTRTISRIKNPPHWATSLVTRESISISESQDVARLARNSESLETLGVKELLDRVQHPGNSKMDIVNRTKAAEALKYLVPLVSNRRELEQGIGILSEENREEIVKQVRSLVATKSDLFDPKLLVDLHQIVLLAEKSPIRRLDFLTFNISSKADSRLDEAFKSSCVRQVVDEILSLLQDTSVRHKCEETARKVCEFENVRKQQNADYVPYNPSAADGLYLGTINNALNELIKLSLGSGSASRWFHDDDQKVLRTYDLPKKLLSLKNYSVIESKVALLRKTLKD